MKQLKIATWNVNSIKVRINHVLSFIKDNNIDVILLQETKSEDKNFPHEDFKNAGYYSECYGQKTYNGVAIISKNELHNVVYGIPDFPDENQKRVIGATIIHHDAKIKIIFRVCTSRRTCHFGQISVQIKLAKKLQ